MPRQERDDTLSGVEDVLLNWLSKNVSWLRACILKEGGQEGENWFLKAKKKIIHVESTEIGTVRKQIYSMPVVWKFYSGEDA